MSILRVVRKYKNIISAKQKVKILGLVFLMIIGGLLEMVSVSLVVPFMNFVLNPDSVMSNSITSWICQFFNIATATGFLVIFGSSLALLYIFKNIFLIFEFNLQYKFVYNCMFEMQRKMFKRYLHKPYEDYLNIKSGEVLRIVISDTNNTFALLYTLLTFFSETIVSIILISTIFVISPSITVTLALALITLLAIVSAIVKPKLRQAGEESQDSSTGMNKWLLQAINGIKELKILEKEDYFEQKFALYGYGYARAYRRYQVFGLIPRFSMEAICMSSIFAVIAVMIYRGIELEQIMPILTAVGVAAMRLLPSVNRISSSIAAVAYNEPMLDKVVAVMDELEIGNTEDISDEPYVKSTDINNNQFKEIKIEDVDYHYPNSSKNILDKVSLNIKSGETIGIVGTTGAGKTTFMDVILGLLEPQNGKVLVDSKNIAEDTHYWHKKVGYIPQSIFLLDASIRDNVCFGIDKEKISEGRLVEALREAAILKDIEEMKDGVDTMIGERGVRLSGGQRQRIGIARALYHNPDVLFFDEATSALDDETEAAIMESIENLKGKKTMIIIAHRKNTLKSCDHIYRVDSGGIIMER